MYFFYIFIFYSNARGVLPNNRDLLPYAYRFGQADRRLQTNDRRFQGGHESAAAKHQQEGEMGEGDDSATKRRRHSAARPEPPAKDLDGRTEILDAAAPTSDKGTECQDEGAHIRHKAKFSELPD